MSETSVTDDLKLLLAGRTRVDVAADLGVSAQMVSQWLSGAKRVTSEREEQIRGLAEARGQRGSPNRPPADPVASRPAVKPVVKVAVPKPAEDLPGHELAAKLTAYRKALLNYQRAEKILDGMESAAPRELAAIMGQVNGALSALARAEPNAVKLLGSPEWARVAKALEETLRGYPEVAAKVRDVFRALDAEALADIQAALGPDP